MKHADREPFIPGAFDKSVAQVTALIFYLKEKNDNTKKGEKTGS